MTADMAGKFKIVFGKLLKSLHQLWLEVTGTFLLIFAVVFGYYASRNTGSSQKRRRTFGESVPPQVCLS